MFNNSNNLMSNNCSIIEEQKGSEYTWCINLYIMTVEGFYCRTGLINLYTSRCSGDFYKIKNISPRLNLNTSQAYNRSLYFN